MAYAFFLLTVIGPVALWLWYIRSSDHSEPEPAKRLRQCFYAGIAVALAAGILEYIVFKLFGLPPDIFAIHKSGGPLIVIVTMIALVAPIEELAKYLALRTNTYFSRDFNQVFDGVVYGITVALGFSFVENITYFIDMYMTQHTLFFAVNAAYRGLITTLLHVICTGTVGYYLGKAKFSAGNRAWIIAQGVLYAILIHSFFNIAVAEYIPYGSFIAMVFVVLYFAFFMRLWNSPEARMKWEYREGNPPLSENK